MDKIMSDDFFVFNPKLDGEFLRSIYEDDKEHAEMVFEKFVQSIGVQLNEIDESYHEGDAENFRKRIHKVKPVLSFVGLTWLTSKAEKIEKGCNGPEDIKALSEIYISFRTELFEMIPIVENDLKKLRA
jgi:hypothetical protein